ncbi:mitotic-spindle organizing protein 1-like [Contarinia nasturtii]|uniref:mitotic-spindle organizing protein 1-like n=1 Tax=Contarinia nasturtii TaxID=265458 RepID=UPI0012D399D2|nr:mitotic-spindle organizing protein 1-like [Contarinia nasturtii]XP_031620855.1 mitotic-spindle organizing protein 1-like [Contarinia nasturtii]XP_031620856.1 mitotic-spindle organizing protein 1-like [Contarinia nasturtii]XP_031620857.1 mitotic-spindle organizing protein 1-like [Contarinia nasturtii]XP_031620858.1 mitotic-spindle organizing protein 1-like [Contarinia nasturtii]XP_031620859.1 mitotic-spindle organizing protein 1-like [Contarinia nasturtii]
MRNRNIMSSEQPNNDDIRANGNEQSYIQLQQSQKVRKTLNNMSHLLNTGLNAETLDVCIRLCEAGVHPEALADIVTSIRSEMDALNRDSY